MTRTDQNPDLHGNAPDKSPVALLIVDVVNDMEYEGGEELLEHAIPMAKALRELKERARGARIPVIYANDNFGRWQSDFQKVIDHCLEDGVRGERVVRTLTPESEDYFVLKPKNSAFYSTTLETLLDYLGTRLLVLTGIATNNCVFFTAHDAYMRDFQLIVPRDCVAAIDQQDGEYSLGQMERLLKAEILDSSEIDFGELSGRWDDHER